MLSPFPFAFLTSIVAQPCAWLLSFTIALLAAWLSGAYMARVFTGRETLLSPVLDMPVRLLQRLVGPQAQTRMSWSQAALAALSFSCLLFVLVYAALAADGHDAANAFALAARAVAGDPSGLLSGGLLSGDLLSGDLSRGAAFVGSAATLALCAVTIRALCSPNGEVGNYWSDLIRALICILTPLACLHLGLTATSGVAACLDGWQGSGNPGVDLATAQILHAARGDAVIGFVNLIAPASLFGLYAHISRKRVFGFLICAGSLALTLAAQQAAMPQMPVFLALPWLAALAQLFIHFWLAIPALALAASPGVRRVLASGASS
ncbi:potassium-transporting ATPase subunit KdpA [Asticcacaulis sp. EMRT-3]|uniref:potassium-transporting ATPase subunit KdpA n=1 Tax=Asticcacaulis sp. EMRT-3 TaxID=3040349 RepID=UPI0024AF92DC|nr:potassium-transporting ATPase subunit KdpA [Asticcacaulis sp. EMRT-3]MDI7776008.1 potassium-transporting ATPase subunit KdpA [Asticcacaulis sp. EMRT-3]